MKKIREEDIICKTRNHWITLVVPAIISFFLTISSVMGFIEEKTDRGFYLIFIIVSLLIFVVPYFYSKINVIKLSEKEILGRTGIIKVRKLHAPISKIQTVNVEKGLFGRIFGYSDLTIHCITGIYVFKNLDHLP